MKRRSHGQTRPNATGGLRVRSRAAGVDASGGPRDDEGDDDGDAAAAERGCCGPPEWLAAAAARSDDGGAPRRAAGAAGGAAAATTAAAAAAADGADGARARARACAAAAATARAAAADDADDARLVNAVRGGFWDACRMLAREAPRLAARAPRGASDGRAALHHAAAGGAPPGVVAALVRAAPRALALEDADGSTPVMMAALGTASIDRYSLVVKASNPYAPHHLYRRWPRSRRGTTRSTRCSPRYARDDVVHKNFLLLTTET